MELSTDSAEAAALFDRAVEHYLKYHVDTMRPGERSARRRSGFRHGALHQGLPDARRRQPGAPPAIAASLAAAEAGAATATLARTAPRRGTLRLAARRPRGRIRDLARDARCRPDRSAGGADQRHHAFPLWPHPDGAANRRTASPRLGRPTFPDTTVSCPSGPSRMRKPGIPPAPSARSIALTNATRRISSPTMSRRTSSKWTAGPREGNDWLGRADRLLADRQQSRASLVVAPRADAARSRRA